METPALNHVDVMAELHTHVAEHKKKGPGHKFDHPEHVGDDAVDLVDSDEDVEFAIVLDAFPPLTEDQVERAMALFDSIDRDNSQTIETTELSASLRTATSETYSVLGDLVARSVISRSLFARWLAELKENKGDQLVEAVITALSKSSRPPLSSSAPHLVSLQPPRSRKLIVAFPLPVNRAALTAKEEKRLCELYEAMDANGDGSLDRNEVAFLLRHSKGSVVRSLLDYITDFRGFIDLEIFLQAMSHAKLERGAAAFGGIMGHLKKMATDGIDEAILIAELEHGWGEHQAGPPKPPHIFLSILRPALVAKLGRPQLHQLFNKKLHLTQVVRYAADAETNVDPLKTWSGEMTIYSDQIWFLNPGKGVELGDTLLHVACRAQNQTAIRFLLEHGCEKSRKNAGGQTAYECILGSSAQARLARDEFPCDWIQRLNTLQAATSPPQKLLPLSEEELRVEDDFFAGVQADYREAQGPLSPKSLLRGRNAKIKAQREAERRRGLGLGMASTCVPEEHFRTGLHAGHYSRRGDAAGSKSPMPWAASSSPRTLATRAKRSPTAAGNAGKKTMAAAFQDTLSQSRSRPGSAKKGLHSPQVPNSPRLGADTVAATEAYRQRIRHETAGGRRQYQYAQN